MATFLKNYKMATFLKKLLNGNFFKNLLNANFLCGSVLLVGLERFLTSINSDRNYSVFGHSSFQFILISFPNICVAFDFLDNNISTVISADELLMEKQNV